MSLPRLRFPEFSGNWKEKTIGERLSKVIDYRGKAPPKSETGMPLMTARNVRMGYLDFAADEYIEEKLYKSWMNRGLPKPNDVMFTTEAPLGNVALYPSIGTYALGQRIITLQTKEAELDSIFLFQYLLGPIGQDKINKRGTGSTAKGIKSKVFVKIPMEAPSLPEQKKIAAFLGVVDAKIAALRAKVSGLETYKRGLMQALFSQTLRFTKPNGTAFPDWEEKKLGEVANIYDGTHQTPTYVEKGVQFFSVEQVTANNFYKTKFISELVFELESRRTRIERDDILMTRIGDIGTARLIDWDVRASFYVSLALIKCIKPLNSAYLSHCIAATAFQKELWKRTIHVAFPKKINLGEIGNCLVKLPHPNEQQKIADALSAMDAKIQAVAAQVSHMETFKKGLLQQMFV